MSGAEAAEGPTGLKPHPQVVARRLEDELVLVQLDRNSIYALNRTGARFWELIVERGDRSEAFAQMLEEFDVPRSELEGEIDSLMELLFREGLLVRSEE